MTFGVDDVGAANAFTTVGLPVPVTVTVPDAYDSTLLVPLTSVLLATGQVAGTAQRSPVLRDSAACSSRSTSAG